MEQKSECKHCNTTEEEIYWKHFTFIHFFLTLPSHFHDHLKLPMKFSAHMKAQVPERVSLKGPSGASWDIELRKSDDLIFVGKEWKDFVKVNCLKENCLLVFKYVRDSIFEVLIFDQGSCCEKESTYFVKNCKHTMSDQEDQNIKKVVRSSPCTEIIEDDGEEETPVVASKKLRLDNAADICSNKKENAATSRKGVLAAASKRGGKPIKQNAQSTKGSNIIEKANEGSHTLQRDEITLENGKSYLERDELHKSEALFERRLNRSDAAEACSSEKVNASSLRKGVISAASNHGGKARKRKAQSNKMAIVNDKDKEVSQMSQRDVSTRDNEDSYPEKDDTHMSKALPKKSLNENGIITLASAENSPASNELQILKDQSEKQPNWNVTASEPHQVSEMNLMLIEDGESNQVIYSRNLEAQFDKSLITPEIEEAIPLSCYSNKTKGQAGDYYSSRSDGKSNAGRPKKQVLPKSSNKVVSKSASDRKKSCSKVISNRRPVTETEKANALQRANQKQTEDGFTVVMRRSNLYPKYFLHLPSKLLHKYPLRENQEVVLRVGEKTWQSCYRFYGANYRGLTAGWRKFVLDNMLEEFDVLVLKPVSLKEEASFVIDVDLFRVI